ncbi:AraC family transcriptional regulator [Caballeronia udeis]|uniref:AraC family transcriptional regulator n=1 Tax=Caballeronia udeis TaxID=1232866 RepID=A0A158IB65_9BURK|nr:helix-turn-helix transcriptional regulator [Caballeronia udeis]SAL53784.1 AraC family transcriptional regulator [Caballeronia udeis]
MNIMGDKWIYCLSQSAYDVNVLPVDIPTSSTHPVTMQQNHINNEISLNLNKPTPARPVRAKVQRLFMNQEVSPHRHPWAQLAFSITGMTRLIVEDGVFIVAPWQALWIPANVGHAVTVPAETEVYTLYFLEDAIPVPPNPVSGSARWERCRVIEVSDLLRAVVLQMDPRPDDDMPTVPDRPERERLLVNVAIEELSIAPSVPLGIELPKERRIRRLCQAVLENPMRHSTLDTWAEHAGASPRTIARLFRRELGIGFSQWRKKVLLAEAVSRAEDSKPINEIAAELGYTSTSAFSAMVKRSAGMSLTQLLSRPLASKIKTPQD